MVSEWSTLPTIGELKMTNQKWNPDWDAGGAFNEYGWPDHIKQIALDIHQLGMNNPLTEIPADEVADMIQEIIEYGEWLEKEQRQ